MQVIATKLAEGSLHLRIYDDGLDLSTFPPYSAHTILEPDGKGGCFLNGLDSKVDKSGFKKCIEIAKQEGFRYISWVRVKNGVKLLKTQHFLRDSHV
jgi:hypothetical protein